MSRGVLITRVKPRIQLTPTVPGRAAVDVATVGVVIVLVVVVVGLDCSVGSNGRAQDGGDVLYDRVHQQTVVINVLRLRLDVIKRTVHGGRRDHLVRGVEHVVLIGGLRGVVVGLDARRTGRGSYRVVVVARDAVNAQVACVPRKRR